MLHHPLSEGLDVLLSFVHQWLALVVRLVEEDGGEVVDLEALDLVQRSVHLGNRHAADLLETLAELRVSWGKLLAESAEAHDHRHDGILEFSKHQVELNDDEYCRSRNRAR